MTQFIQTYPTNLKYSEWLLLEQFFYRCYWRWARSGLWAEINARLVRKSAKNRGVRPSQVRQCWIAKRTR